MITKYKLNSEKVLFRMQELGLTYTALAKTAGIGKVTVENAIKKETRITEKTVQKLASGLDIALDVFFGEGYVIVVRPKSNCKDVGALRDKEEQQKIIAILTKNLRARLKYTQISRIELGECTKLSQREIFKLMNGRVNPRITTVYCVAKALAVSIDDLLKEGYDQTLK